MRRCRQRCSGHGDVVDQRHSGRLLARRHLEAVQRLAPPIPNVHWLPVAGDPLVEVPGDDDRASSPELADQVCEHRSELSMLIPRSTVSATGADVGHAPRDADADDGELDVGDGRRRYEQPTIGSARSRDVDQLQSAARPRDHVAALGFGRVTPVVAASTLCWNADHGHALSSVVTITSAFKPSSYARAAA